MSRQLALHRPAAPFLKWAGGKRGLLAQLEPLLPRAFGRYLEPFVGGGALFFHLHSLGRITAGAVLNDANRELMNCYRVVQDAGLLETLIRLLSEHSRHVADKDYYYRLRALDREPGFASRPPAERAARTIFLNHTCYNGLYRLNRKGQFNVPYGRWRRPPRIFDEANLRACHCALQGVELREEDFAACLDWAQAGDFVYLDPPYYPLSPTSSFTTYTGTPFTEADQRRLAEVFRELDRRGCLVMLTNSATPLVERLFAGFRRSEIAARRAINSRASGRGAIPELAITNYEPPRCRRGQR